MSETAVLFIGFDRPIVGREEQAMAALEESRAMLPKLRAEGWCTRADHFFLTAHGGDLNGAFLLYGERAKLDELRRTDAFEAWVFRLSSCVNGLGVIPGVTGEGIAAAFARRQKATRA